MINNTIYKEMEASKSFLLVQNKDGHKRYINGHYNPEIEITFHPDGAKHFDTYNQAEKELKELQLDKVGFIIEEHQWI